MRITVGGPGSVSSDVPGIVCGKRGFDCAAAFGRGLTIRLTPAAEPGAVFVGWGGACRGAGVAACDLVVGADQTTDGDITATFRRIAPQPGLQPVMVFGSVRGIKSQPSGLECGPTCSATFPSGTVLSLGYAELWFGDCVGKASVCAVVSDGPLNVFAAQAGPTGSASRPAKFGVTVNVSGRGRVTGGSTIRCSRASGSQDDCGELFDPGSTIVLKATPARNFLGWRGFCAGKRTRCRLAVTAPKTVQAVFRH